MANVHLKRGFIAAPPHSNSQPFGRDGLRFGYVRCWLVRRGRDKGNPLDYLARVKRAKGNFFGTDLGMVEAYLRWASLGHEDNCRFLAVPRQRRSGPLRMTTRGWAQLEKSPMRIGAGGAKARPYEFNDIGNSRSLSAALPSRHGGQASGQASGASPAPTKAIIPPFVPFSTRAPGAARARTRRELQRQRRRGHDVQGQRQQRKQIPACGRQVSLRPPSASRT